MTTSDPFSTISVSNLAKSFGSAQAVHNVSFEVRAGEIFGLLGPNGAGKTTTIRMILDIFKPDKGEICVLGGPMTERKKEQIGYLPEERGLYKDLKVEECVLYLAELKGLSRRTARERAQKYFQQLDLVEHKNKKVNDLSKGMQQKVQVITTLIHQPKLVMIDEPFSGLDPVNTRLIQEMLMKERERGTSIVMSTHQMYQVEEMCDRIVLINKGDSVLYGPVDDIRRRYADNAVRVVVRGDLPAIPGVLETSHKGPSTGSGRSNEHTLRLPKDMPPEALLRTLADTPGLTVESFELAIPTMDDIFVRVVSGE
jgi:ABC-2 type transport system ATP-binding protein